MAVQFRVSRQTLHTWLTRYQASGLAGLMDRTHRPESCRHQADAEVETRVCELRREHPWWGPRRIAHELARTAAQGSHPPGKSTVHRILRRHGLIEPAGGGGNVVITGGGNARCPWRYGKSILSGA